MSKRGQAAMEFLMTYGWAILAAIVVIGVLAIYFRPSSIVAGAAIVSAPFYANAQSISATTVSIELQNNGGETYTITSVAVDVTSPTSASCTTNDVDTVMESGQLSTISLDCAGLTSGATMRGDITITYRKTGSSLDLTSTGTISGTAS